MVTVARPVRMAMIGAAAAAVTVGPAVVLSAGQPEGAVAQPCGVNINVMQIGAPVGSGCPAQAPVISGGAGAPSQEILSACSGIPGCLSSIYYGPGNVQVPQRDTKVRQSQ